MYSLLFASASIHNTGHPLTPEGHARTCCPPGSQDTVRQSTNRHHTRSTGVWETDEQIIGGTQELQRRCLEVSTTACCDRGVRWGDQPQMTQPSKTEQTGTKVQADRRGTSGRTSSWTREHLTSWTPSNNQNRQIGYTHQPQLRRTHTLRQQLTQLPSDQPAPGRPGRRRSPARCAGTLVPEHRPATIPVRPPIPRAPGIQRRP